MKQQLLQTIDEFQTVDELPVRDDTIVSYSGVPGAFAEQAAITFFGEQAHTLPVANFREVMEALAKGNADYGVLPIENSSAGNVETNYDLLSEYDMTIVGEQVIEVNQAVMVLPDASLSDIRKVYSHPQALMQCSRYLERMGWEQINMVNTALSAMKVRDDKDKTQAAIASQRAANLFGLKIVTPIGNNNSNNATRFIILHKNRITAMGANKIGITLGLPHESGSLYEILGSFNRHELNMTMIASRPIPGRQWEYYFYMEFIGSLESEEVKQALLEIEESSINLRILGNYRTLL